MPLPRGACLLAALIILSGPEARAQNPQGAARAWGTYSHYDSGTGSFTTYPMTAPSGLSNVVALVSGVRHVAALRADGSLVSWGEWEWGITNVPSGLLPAVAVAAGDYHTVALSKTGKVYAWGVDFQGQLKIPPQVTNAVVVGAGGFHSLALTAWGQVFGWGRNLYGQCTAPAGLSNNVVALTGGLEHSLALLRDGRVVAWGDNSVGQTNVPPAATNIVAIAARGYYSLALRADGAVLGWGTNANGLTTIPGNVTGALAIAAGENHCLAVLGNRAIVGWGNNAAGQTTIPAGTTNAFAIAAGSLHSAASLGPVPPEIVQPPVDVAAYVGQSATFAVQALGAPGLAYQWRHAGTNLAGGTAAALTLAAAEFADAGGYDVVVTNLAGRTTSAVAQLQVLAPATTAQFLLEDRTTLGNWRGAYGTQAYAVFGQATNFAGGTGLTVSNAASYVFNPNTTDPRALEQAGQPNPANRFSACVYHDTAISFEVTLPAGATNQLAVYLMEPDGGRTEQVELLHPSTGTVLDARVVAGISNGVYALWEVTGPVRVRVSRVTGANAVVSGLFVGSPQFKVPSLSYSPPGSTNLIGDRVVLSVGAEATPALTYQWRRFAVNYWLEVTNSATVTGAQRPVLEFGAFRAADAGDYSVRVSNFFGWTTSAVARLRVPGAVATASFVAEDRTTRGNWKGVYGTAGSMIFGLATNLPPALGMQVAQGNYFLFESNTPAPNALERTDSAQPTNRFLACIYADSAIVLDAPLPLGTTNRLAVYVQEPGGGRVEQVELLDTASGLPLDSRTVGNLTDSTYLVWDVSGPVQVRITRLSGGNAVASGVFFGTATGQAPLVRAQPASQTVAVGGAVSLGVGVNGSPSLNYQWLRNDTPLADAAGRSGAQQPVLRFAGFQPGDAGDYRVVVSNALGSATSLVAKVEVVGATASAKFLLEDRTTAGNWRGVYGSGGYVVFGLATNLSFTASGAAFYPFNPNTSDPRALERADGANPTNRFLACVYADNAMTFDLALPAGSTNRVGVYVMEPGGGRTEQVEILDATAGLVLDTRVVGGLATAAHLLWEVVGPVRVRVTRVAGANALVSGLFLGSPLAQAPLVTMQPASQVASPGGAVALGVGVSGSPALSWQWRRNGQPLVDTGTIVGARQPVLNLRQLQAAELGNFSVVVSNAFGTVTSAVATVQFAPSNGSWVTGVSRGPGGGVALQLSGVPGLTYVVQAASSLAPANWVNLCTNVAATDGSFQCVDPNAAALPQRFYRTRLP